MQTNTRRLACSGIGRLAARKDGEMICTIINPSDPYTLETDNFIPAAIGIALVGRGQLGLSCDSENLHSPVLFGWDEWLASHIPEGIDTWLESDTNREAMASALASVLISTCGDRVMYESTLRLIDDPDKCQQFREEWHDRRRSSMNDIGYACRETARRMRESMAARKDGER